MRGGILKAYGKITVRLNGEPRQQPCLYHRGDVTDMA